MYSRQIQIIYSLPTPIDMGKSGNFIGIVSLEKRGGNWYTKKYNSRKRVRGDHFIIIMYRLDTKLSFRGV